jgi:UDP-glucose 4-epimerase
MARLLITGGTGSFGETMVRSVLAKPFLNIKEVIVFSRDEKKQHELRNSINDSRLKFIIGDVRDRHAIEHAMKGVDIVFHAAALKHVPTGEFFPVEMVKTNIIGTENVLSAAENNGVKKLVVLTTDKAVYPINTMGMSKAIAEKLMISKARNKSKTVFCAVRYGNVMASRGSVIPLFYDQIKEGKKLTITNPDMTRFLLSLEDAISLVRFAIEKGRSGDIFIKKSPAARIQHIAEAMLNIFNATSGIKIVGTREGEKLHETLATEYELSTAEDMGDYFRIPNISSVDYDSFYKKGKKIDFSGDYTSDVTTQLSTKEVEKLLKSLEFIKKRL